MIAPRDEFLARLRSGMRGLPQTLIDETIADYAGHFDEGRAAGRDEEQVARALGDPSMLSRQFRLEIDISAWETSNTPRTGWRVVVASFRRASDPVVHALLGMTALLLTALMVPMVLGLLAAGLWLAIDGGSLGIPGGAPVTWLVAVALIAAALSIGAATALGLRSMVNRLVERVRHRLHVQSNTRTTA